MKAICFNFEIHQPFRLKRYRFFDIGRDHYYFDDFTNDDIITRIAHNSYIPAAETLLRMVEANQGRFRFSIAISGVALEQLEHYVPEFLDVLKKLADTGCVEFVAQPFAYSLASLTDPEEFAQQVADTCSILRSRFGVTPKVIRNTELIYDDDIAPQMVEMGFKGVLTEGAKHILGWKSPNYVYTAASAPDLRLLLRNGKLSDDIAYRFSDTSWSRIPPHCRQIYRLDCLYAPRGADCQHLPQHGDIRRPSPCHDWYLPVPRGTAPLRCRARHRLRDPVGGHCQNQACWRTERHAPHLECRRGPRHLGMARQPSAKRGFRETLLSLRARAPSARTAPSNATGSTCRAATTSTT